MFYTEALVFSEASSLVGKFYNYPFVILCGETALRRCFKERFPKAVFQDHTKTKAINEIFKAPDTLMQRMPSARKRATVSSAGKHATVSSAGKHATVPSAGKHATVPSAGKHATLSSAGKHATVSSEGKHATVPSAGKL